MNTSEIWSFPLEHGGHGLLRVVLALKDLNLNRLQPLGFLGDWLLVQISRHDSLAEDSFAGRNLLFNGVLVYKYRYAKKLGFKQLAEKQVGLEEVEFPGWFADSRETPVFFRGELRYVVESYSFEFIHEHLRILLSANFPALDRLAWLISDYHAYLKSIAEGTIKKGIGINGSDVRYNVKRAEILQAIGVSFDEPYYKVVARELGEERLSCYEKAIIPPSKT